MNETRAEIFLKSLVNSSSPTMRQDEVKRTHVLLATALQELGFTINWLKDPSGKTEDLLLAEKPGSKTQLDPNAFITCVSHIDTVLAPQETGDYRRESHETGLRARGAGIIDNKGGLAVLVESLRLFFQSTPNHECGFRVVSSPDEENGSSAWHATFRDIGLKSRAVLGFEPAMDDGSIISSRRGNRWYNIDIEGIEAHAGRCKGEEINAAFESAFLVVRLIEARDRLRARFSSEPGLGVSLQIGHIEGGRDRHNVVCGSVSLKLDTRFSSFEERDALEYEISKILATPREKNLDDSFSKIRSQIVDDCPPFATDAKTEALVQELCFEIATEEKTAVKKPAKAGGAGDVNHMSRPGLLVLDGLGPVGGRMHTTEEFLVLSTLQSRAAALAKWYPSLIRSLQSPLGK
ncbi:M20 family metallopeptidase [soil metagenome]